MDKFAVVEDKDKISEDDTGRQLGMVKYAN
jgi:hypothetical protein